jgi:alpha-L-rhamnosidase
LSARQVPKSIYYVLVSLFALTLTLPMWLAHIPAAGADEGSTAPVGLRVNDLAEPADLDDLSSPSFSWQVLSTTQSAYRIVVSSDAVTAAEGTGDTWDSGKVASAEQTNVPYGGPELEPNQRYYWSVETWDADDVASGPSETTWFGTAPGSTWGDSEAIWASLPDNDAVTWGDYTATMNVTITQTALGVLFRAPDSSNGLMWQFRADTNTIVPHTLKNGTYAALPAVQLPAGTIALNTPLEIAITVEGTTVTTSIDGTEVHETEMADAPAEGKIGFRTGRTEAGQVHDVAVTAADGTDLLTNDFASSNPFSCGSIEGGNYLVKNSLACTVASPDQNDDWALLRTEFAPKQDDIVAATLYATAGDFRDHKQYAYKAYINGEFVGLGPTNHIDAENRYDGFDVTDLITSGDNAIGVIAYTQNEQNQRFIAMLRIDYADGTTQTVSSGDDWQTMTGGEVWPDVGSIGTNFYAAPKENLDLQHFPSGFDEAGFDDSAWQPATVKTQFEQLEATPTAKVEEQLHAPVNITEVGDGHYFVDFGETWIGGVNLTFENGTAGQQVDLRFAEVPTTKGGTTAKYQLNTGNTYQDVVTLRDGEQTIETWGMRVFRYVEIIGAPEEITAENLSALALVYPFNEEASSFTSSNDNLNQVYELSKHSIEALNVNFYTDSWTRERINYEADAYLQQMSTLYLMEDLSLGQYSMNYFESNRTWPTEWPIYVVLAVHDAWAQTGNIGQVSSYYDNLVEKLPTQWLNDDTGLIGKSDRSNGCNSQTDCDIVDWPTSQRDGYEYRYYNTVLNALSYRAYVDMANMAEALDKPEDATTFQNIADGIRDGMNEHLFDAENNRYDDGMTVDGTLTGHYSLHASAFSLAFGVVDDAHAASVAEYVASRGMACSVYCAGFSITGLFNGGQADAAIDQLSADGTSSWMNMIDRGAGATSEAWDESQKSNLTYSHPWAASPAFHVPSGLFGIKPVTAGYSTFEIAPQPGSLDYGTVTVPTVKGEVGAGFAHDGAGDLAVIAQVPGNTSASVTVPVPDGTTQVFVDGDAVDVTPTGGNVVLEDVTAGCHLVTLSAGSDAASDANLTSICDPTTDEPGPEPAPAWDSTATYNEGDTVTYNGSTWEASWWTRNQAPGDAYGPWQEIKVDDDGNTVWTPSRIYDTGDVVIYESEFYVAKWWTRNQAPGDQWGPWELQEG